MADKEVDGFFHLAGKTARVYVAGRLKDSGSSGTDTEYSLVSEQVVSEFGTVLVHSLFYGSVKAGLAYTAKIKTLPVSFEVAAASRGMTKNINGISVRMSGRGTANAGPSESKLAPMVVPVAATGEMVEMVEIPFHGDWNTDGRLVVTHADPEPFMLQAMAVEVAAGG